MLVAARAVLLPLDALGMRALVLGGEVIAILALAAGENDLVASHVYYYRRREDGQTRRRVAVGAFFIFYSYKHAIGIEPMTSSLPRMCSTD